MNKIEKTLFLSEGQYSTLTTLLHNFVYSNVNNPTPERGLLEVPTILTGSHHADDIIDILEQLANIRKS